MNCKDIEYLITDYQNHNLDEATLTLVENHLKSCTSCNQMYKEFKHLIITINQVQEELPHKDLELNFNKMLAKEKLALKTFKSIILNPKNKVFKSILQMAATILVMVSCYLFGSYNNNASNAKEIAELKQDKEEIQTIAMLSLIENKSASKRIQAVNYSQELENPDDDILNALINEMLSDKLVNVRLASARALERFTEYNIVKDAYIEALKNEVNTSMQIELIEILVHIKEKRAVPKIKELIDDKDTPGFIKNQLKSELQNLI